MSPYEIKQRGLAFVLVLAFILILAGAATTFIVLSGTEIRMVRRQCDSTKAFYIAEAGVERARYDLILDIDWFDGDINGTSTDLVKGDMANFYPLNYSQEIKTSTTGEFTVWLKDTGEEDKIWIKSKGEYGDSKRIIEAKLYSPRSSSNTVTCAIEVEGNLEIKGNAEINGEVKEKVSTAIDIAINAGDVLVPVADTTGFDVGDHVLIDNETAQEETGNISSVDAGNSITLESGLSFDHSTGTSVDRILSFEDIFGIDKAGMEEIARDYYHYDSAFNNGTAENITWVNGGEAESKITTDDWAGGGIFIVNGDLKITGGTFDGVIWVIGVLRISGNPVINGGLFVECGVTVDTTITGTAIINYSKDAIDDAFYTLNSSQSTIEFWQEVD